MEDKDQDILLYLEAANPDPIIANTRLFGSESDDNMLTDSQPDYANTAPAARRSRSPTRDRENNSSYRDQRSPATNNYDRSDRRPSRSLTWRTVKTPSKTAVFTSATSPTTSSGTISRTTCAKVWQTHQRNLQLHYEILTRFTAGQVLFADVLELPNGMSKVSKIQAGLLALPIHICTH
jgi:hypothetical protein